jgi:hypothetical protein
MLVKEVEFWDLFIGDTFRYKEDQKGTVRKIVKYGRLHLDVSDIVGGYGEDYGIYAKAKSSEKVLKYIKN